MKQTKFLLTAACIAMVTLANAQEIVTDVPWKINGGVQKAFRETKKVAIGYFGVSQTIQNSAATTAAGGKAYAKMTVNFGGVDMDAYQALLKEAYDKAVSKLQGLGYEVMTAEQMKATGESTYIPDNAPKSYKTQSGTVVVVDVQPPVTMFEMDMTPLGSNPMLKKARSINAHLMNFVFGATAVSYDRGSRLGKKATTSASPYLTFGGYLNTYPAVRLGSPAVISVGTKTGVEGFEGPEGIYETSKNSKPWMGSSIGKYALDVNQEKYLSLVREMLLQSVEKSIDRWHKELND